MKKYALHFGVGKVDYNVNGDYKETRSSVTNCEYYHNLVLANDFESKIFLTESATSLTLINELKTAARYLKSGDLFFLSYSGHGQTIEPGHIPYECDQVLFLYDRVFLDDEFKHAFLEFDDGVYIFIISNSCMNGSFIDKATPEMHAMKTPAAGEKTGVSCPVPMADKDWEGYISESHYIKYIRAIKFYVNPIEELKNPLIHIASSSDLENSRDTLREGILSEFTEAIQKCIANGFKGTYQELYNELERSPFGSKPYLEARNNHNASTGLFLNSPFLSAPGEESFILNINIKKLKS